MNNKNQFKKIEKLGEGAYGTVYKCLDNNSGQYIALKVLKNQISSQKQGLCQSQIREISLLRRLQHPNIVKLNDVLYLQKKETFQLVFEYIEFDLKKYIALDQKQHLTNQQVKSIMLQILSAVDYMHSKQIIHRDLKPQNILICSTEQVKVTDFGLARSFSSAFDNYTSEISTLWYRAPEVMLGDDKYFTSVDIWAIGCIFIELINKVPAFEGDCQIDQLFKIFKVLGTPNEKVYPGVKKLKDFSTQYPCFPKQGIKAIIRNSFYDNEAICLIEELMVLNPLERISCREALKHKYFSK